MTTNPIHEHARPIPDHPQLPVLYRSERGTWPARLPCQHCRGAVWETGDALACLQCSRAVAEIRDRRPVAFFPSDADDQRRKPKRPPGAIRTCAECSHRLADDNKSGRCRPHYHASRAAAAKGRAS